eukprot:559238-Rhodomonas_salina.1
MEVLRESDQTLLNWDVCANCMLATDHCSPLCPRPRSRHMPCNFCSGAHHEHQCPGPPALRTVWYVRRENFATRVKKSHERALAGIQKRKAGAAAKAKENEGEANGGGAAPVGG